MTDATLHLLSKYASEIHKLDLSGLCQLSDDEIAAFLQKCVNLKHLDVQGCENFGVRSVNVK